MEALRASMPTGARALIIAEEEFDNCDSTTDYYATKRGRRVAIGWRTTDRESFPALRKAAARFPETAHLGPGLDRWTARLVFDHDYSDTAAREACYYQGQDHYYRGQNVHGLGDEGQPPTFGREGELAEWIAQHSAPAGTEWKIGTESNEHRENWSMGAGNYLKAAHRYGTGWVVRSVSLSWLEDPCGSYHLDGLELAPCLAGAPSHGGQNQGRGA